MHLCPFLLRLSSPLGSGFCAISPSPHPGPDPPQLLADPSLVVDVLSADDLVDDPVEHVEDEEGHGEADAGYFIDLLGPLDEEFAHLLGGLGWRRRRVGGGVVVGTFDRDAVLGLQTGRAHPVGKVEATLSSLILLEQIQHGALLKIRQGLGTLPARHSPGGPGRARPILPAWQTAV